MAALSGNSDGIHSASLRDVETLLAGTTFRGVPLMTERGLIPPGSDVPTRIGSEAREIAIGDGIPRVLSALGVVLLTNPSDVDVAALSQDADIVPNVVIPCIQPVSEQNSDNCHPWHLDKINVLAARSQSLMGQGVRVGVLDTGIDATHSEFAGKSIHFAEFDQNGFLISTTPRDAGTHGTHVCGLIAGSTVGVAPKADLAVAAVLTFPDSQGRLSRYLAQIMGGLNWLAHSNFSTAPVSLSRCPIVNASLGGNSYNNYLLSSLQIIQSAPAALLIGAIGNSGRSGLNNHGSPGNYQIVCGIGATDAGDMPADFSDWGIETNAGVVKPDMSAPGVDICSAIPGGGYGRKSGTSMATPIVAGAAALVIQKHPALARNPIGLQSRMLSLTDSAPALNPAATQLGFNKIGRGRLDLSTI
jgi:subtilisin family serine protease